MRIEMQKVLRNILIVLGISSDFLGFLDIDRILLCAFVTLCCFSSLLISSCWFSPGGIP